MPTLGQFFIDFIKYFFSHNVVLLIVCIGMLTLLLSNPMIGKKNVKPFIVVVILLVVTALIDDVDHTLETYHEITTMCEVQTARKIFASIAYSIKPAIPFAIACIVGNPQHKRYYTYWIPLGISTFVYILNIFLPESMAFFYFNECNEFVTNNGWGLLRFANAFTAFVYIIIIIGTCIRIFKNRTFGEMFVIIFSVIACFGGHAMESFFSLFDLGNQCTATAVMFFFLFLLIKYTNIDPLTDAYNRQYFYSTSNSKKIVTGVISIDVNDLKAINDKYGHVKGDQALITIADKLLTVMSRKVMVFRMGGDEFIVTCSGLDKAQVESLVHLIDRMINTNSEYKVAIGYAVRSSFENRDSLLMKADSMMYENKKQMKENASK